jgi:hypothetical protein
MLIRSRVVAALEAKKEHFRGSHEHQTEHLRQYREALQQLPNWNRTEILERLQAVDRPGAYPSAEHDSLHSVVLPFATQWQSHQEAREWASQVLLDQPVMAVDGSQIPPSRDFSIPVAAVQIGWFENPHASGQPYDKDLTFEILSPAELYGEMDEADEAEGGGGMLGENLVNLRRFQAECARLNTYMRASAERSPRPVAFFDGSLVVSFAGNMNDKLRQRYVYAVKEMLQTSVETRVPLIGYVDTSYARDVSSMLRHLHDLPATVSVNDGQLWRPLLYWGDRSPLFTCARDDDILPLYGELSDQVCFTYLKTTAEGQPARIELPAWLVEDEVEKERVLDIIRAECVVGNGYPYALETADAVAVISMEDRERFYATFQRFATLEGLPLRYSRKSLSKRRRR